MQTNKHFTVPVEYKDSAGGAGEVVARFSTFDITDRDGDVVRRSAFKDGQTVPMVWAHDWTTPIGKGRVVVKDDHAEFHGQFLSTTAAQQARTTVREMGDLQEWSFGFRIADVQPNPAIQGYDITAAEIFEVSPVLVGANQETATLAVKSASESVVKDAGDVMAMLGDLTDAELSAVQARCEELLSEMEASTQEESALKDNASALLDIEQERLALEAAELGEAA